MKSSVVLALSSAALVAGLRQCTGSSRNEGGNWFCGAVSQILYSNVGNSGSYQAVSRMGNDGSCEFEEHPYSGSLGPFNEEVRFACSACRRLLTRISSPLSSEDP